jgi:hypothetical protein
MAPPTPAKSDPRDPLPSLEVPEWLNTILLTFANQPTVVAYYKSVHLEQVRAASLAERSEATASTRAKIAATALAHDKSEKWKLMNGRIFKGPEGDDAYLPGNNKCNLFVYEMLALSGVRVPLTEYESRFNSNRLRPPLAREWANPQFAIPGFEVLKVPPDIPQPGDVAARAKVSWDATGHVGIVAGAADGSTRSTVSARSDGVVHNDWGFRANNDGPVVFRRYVGTAK